MLREGVNRDVAFSDDHHASHSPVIWNHTVVTENMWLSDLGHFNHAGQLVQQVEDRFHLSENGGVVDETIDDKMKHWGWSFLRCPTNVTNRGTQTGAHLHVWQVKVSTHATAKVSQRPPKAGTKEYQCNNGSCVPSNSTRTPTQQRPTAPGGLQVPAAELFDPTPPERRASGLAFRGAVLREGSRSRLALPHRTLVPGPGTGPTALGSGTLLSAPWRARSFPGRYQRCIEPGVECADPASTNWFSPFDSYARLSVSQTSRQ